MTALLGGLQTDKKQPENIQLSIVYLYIRVTLIIKDQEFHCTTYSSIHSKTFLLYKFEVDRVPKKSMFAEWPAEFSVYSRDKYKNFLLTKFLKILQNARAHQQLM